MAAAVGWLLLGLARELSATAQETLTSEKSYGGLQGQSGHPPTICLSYP